MGASQKKLSFEASIKKIEEIVESLEQGEIPLEKSLKLFEEGIKQIRSCQQELSTAQLTVEKLIKKENNLSTEPFDPEQVD